MIKPSCWFIFMPAFKTLALELVLAISGDRPKYLKCTVILPRAKGAEEGDAPSAVGDREGHRRLYQALPGARPYTPAAYE
jgi:hypothetical protein